MGHPREQSTYTASLGLYKLMWQNCFSRPIGCTGDTGKASMKSIVFIKSIAHFGTQCLLSQHNIQYASLVSIYGQKARLAYIFSFSARNMKGKPSSTSATVCSGLKGRHFWPWPCRSHRLQVTPPPSFLSPRHIFLPLINSSINAALYCYYFRKPEIQMNS